MMTVKLQKTISIKETVDWFNKRDDLSMTENKLRKAYKKFIKSYKVNPAVVLDFNYTVPIGKIVDMAFIDEDQIMIDIELIPAISDSDYNISQFRVGEQIVTVINSKKDVARIVYLSIW